MGGEAVIRFQAERSSGYKPSVRRGFKCLNAKDTIKDVNRITKYWKTGQWLWEACVTDLEKPPPQGPPAQSADLKDKTGVESAES